MVGIESVVSGYAMRFVLMAMFGLFSAAAAGPGFLLPGMMLGLVSSVVARF